MLIILKCFKFMEIKYKLDESIRRQTDFKQRNKILDKVNCLLPLLLI